MGESDAAKPDSWLTDGDRRSMRPDEAMSLMGGSEQMARRSLRPPRLRRGTALGWIVAGCGQAYIWLFISSRFVRDSNLGTVWFPVGGLLTICAAVMVFSAYPDATWGVAVGWRAPAARLQRVARVSLGVVIVAGSLGSALGSAESAVRCSVTIVVGAIWTVLIETTRRRIGRPVVWSCLAAAVAWAWIILAAWTRLGILLLGGSYVVWGVRELAAVSRDERRRGQRRPVPGAK